MSLETLFRIGDILKWVDNSSWHAHQTKIIFRLDAILKEDSPQSVIYTQKFGKYDLTGILLYEQVDGQWHVAKFPKLVRKKWMYNNSVGGGFPSLVTSFRNF
jgi:hypothetical protein